MLKLRPVVVIESPFAAATDVGKEHHLHYARVAMLDAIARGETPLASHLLYTQVLDDDNAEQRDLGMRMGYDVAPAVSKVALYDDLGISNGMLRSSRVWTELGKRVVKRTAFCSGQRWMAQDWTAIRGHVVRGGPTLRIVRLDSPHVVLEEQTVTITEFRSWVKDSRAELQPQEEDR